MGVCSNLCEIASLEAFLDREARANAGEEVEDDASLAEADLDKAEGEIVSALEGMLEAELQHLLGPEELELDDEVLEEVFFGDTSVVPDWYPPEAVRALAAALPSEAEFAAGGASEYARAYYAGFRSVFECAAASGHGILRFFY